MWLISSCFKRIKRCSWSLQRAEPEPKVQYQFLAQHHDSLAIRDPMPMEWSPPVEAFKLNLDGQHSRISGPLKRSGQTTLRNFLPNPSFWNYSSGSSLLPLILHGNSKLKCGKGREGLAGECQEHDFCSDAGPISLWQQRKVLPIASDLSGVPLFLFPFHCQPKPLISCEMCHVSHLFLWGLCVCFIKEHSQNLDKSSISRFQVKSPHIWGLFLGLAFSWTLKRIKWADVITATSKNLPSVYKFYYPASPQLQYWLKLRRTKSIFLTLQTSHSSEITCGWPLKFA